MSGHVLVTAPSKPTAPAEAEHPPVQV
jgi:hypothetical protein